VPIRGQARLPRDDHVHTIRNRLIGDLPHSISGLTWLPESGLPARSSCFLCGFHEEMSVILPSG
jgi:hypothetical protein